jgi:tetratricopeptide (TPR) repeat protein
MAKNKKNEAAEGNAALEKTEAFFVRFKKPVIIVVVAAVVVVGCLMAYKAFVGGPRENRASTILAKGQGYFEKEAFDIALNGDKAGYIGFAKIADEYGSTKAGNLANLYSGLCYANLGKWQDAVKYLKEYSPADDEMVGPAAIGALGDAYAHVNQLDDAVSCFKKAAKRADSDAADGTNNSFSPTFLLKAGKILESQGKTDEALSIYQDIKKKYVNSQLVMSSDIDKYIERASYGK